MANDPKASAAMGADENEAPVMMSDLEIHEAPAPKPQKVYGDGDMVPCVVKHGSLVMTSGIYMPGAPCKLPYADARLLVEQGTVDIVQ